MSKFQVQCKDFTLCLDFGHLGGVYPFTKNVQSTLGSNSRK